MSFAFSKEVVVNYRPFMFHFRGVPASYLSYQVEVTDEKGVKITFSLILSAGDPGEPHPITFRCGLGKWNRFWQPP